MSTDSPNLIPTLAPSFVAQDYPTTASSATSSSTITISTSSLAFDLVITGITLIFLCVVFVIYLIFKEHRTLKNMRIGISTNIRGVARGSMVTIISADTLQVDQLNTPNDVQAELYSEWVNSSIEIMKPPLVRVDSIDRGKYDSSVDSLRSTPGIRSSQVPRGTSIADSSSYEDSMPKANQITALFSSRDSVVRTAYPNPLERPTTFVLSRTIPINQRNMPRSRITPIRTITPQAPDSVTTPTDIATNITTVSATATEI